MVETRAFPSSFIFYSYFANNPLDNPCMVTQSIEEKTSRIRSYFGVDLKKHSCATAFIRMKIIISNLKDILNYQEMSMTHDQSIFNI